MCFILDGFYEFEHEEIEWPPYPGQAFSEWMQMRPHGRYRHAHALVYRFFDDNRPPSKTGLYLFAYNPWPDMLRTRHEYSYLTMKNSTHATYVTGNLTRVRFLMQNEVDEYEDALALKAGRLPINKPETPPDQWLSHTHVNPWRARPRPAPSRIEEIMRLHLEVNPDNFVITAAQLVDNDSIASTIASTARLVDNHSYRTLERITLDPNYANDGWASPALESTPSQPLPGE